MHAIVVLYRSRGGMENEFSISITPRYSEQQQPCSAAVCGICKEACPPPAYIYAYTITVCRLMKQEQGMRAEPVKVEVAHLTAQLIQHTLLSSCVSLCICLCLCCCL